jgi:TorA maturation chaperone TorD
MGPSTIDVKRRYNEAGLDIRKNFSDLPDHVSVELEFMSYLCDKEEKAGSDEDAELWRKRQGEFWKNHLDPWITEFSNKILQSSRSSYYSALALFLKDWIKEEGETTFRDMKLGLKRL